MDIIEELNERKAREKNIIVFGVEETREQDSELENRGIRTNLVDYWLIAMWK